MIPDLTTLFIVLGLVPGWIFWTLNARHVPRAARSGLAEALELVTVGALTTGMAIFALVFLAAFDWPFLVDVAQLALSGDQYLRMHVQRTAGTIALTLALACALAYLLYRVRWRETPEHDPDASVWWVALHKRPRATSPYVGVLLDDGTLIEGLLRSFTTEATESKRDIALERPIRVTAHGVTLSQSVDRVVIPDAIIRWITVIEVPHP